MLKRRRYAAIIAAILSLLILLSACGVKTGETALTSPASDTGSQKPGGKGNITAAGDIFSDGSIYAASYSDLKIEGAMQPARIKQHFGIIKDRLYFVAVDKVGNEEVMMPSFEEGEESGEMKPTQFPVFEDILVSINSDGSGGTKLSDYKKTDYGEMPGGTKQENEVLGLSTDENGFIYIIEKVSLKNVGEGEGSLAAGETYEKLFLRKLAETGAEIKSEELSMLKGSEGALDARMKTDDKGNTAVLNWDMGKVFVFDSELKLKGEIEFPKDKNWIDSLIKTRDGKISIFNIKVESGERVLIPLDLENASRSDKEETVPKQATEVKDGAGEYDILYTTDNAVYGYKIGEDGGKKLLSWLNSDVLVFRVSLFAAFPNGKIFCITDEPNWEGDLDEEAALKYSAAVLTKKDKSELPEKSELLLLSCGMSNEKKYEVFKFNRANEKYRIFVKDYSEYNTQEDYLAGAKKLTEDLKAGKIPDIFDTDSVSLPQLINAGLLSDLMPYLEADEKLGGKDAILPSVLSKMQSPSGKLYSVYSGFIISTAIAKKDNEGDNSEVSTDVARSFIEKMPADGQLFWLGMTKEDAITAIMKASIDRLIDRDTGEVNIDVTEFAAALSFADLFPESFDWEHFDFGAHETDIERIIKGKQLIMPLSIVDENFYEFRNVYNILKGNLVVTGIPGGFANSGTIEFNGGFGMSNACRDKDGAWQFLRSVLSEKSDETMTAIIPVNKAMFESRLTDAMTPKYADDPDAPDGKKAVPHLFGNYGQSEGQRIEIYELTEAERDIILKAIENSVTVFNYNEEISKIIAEEAKEFFGGTVSPEAVAMAAQQKVSEFLQSISYK